MPTYKTKIFFHFSLAFLAGVFVRSFVYINICFLWIFLLPVLIAILFNYKNRRILLFAGIFPFFFLGVWRTDLSLQKMESFPEIHQTVSVPATVQKKFSSNDYSQRLVVKVDKEKFQDAIGKSLPRKKSLFKNDIRLLINAPLTEHFSYGDQITLKCSPKIPANFSENFDYKMYLAKENIFYICQKPNIEKLPNAKKGLLASVLNLKEKLSQNLAKAIPYPESALAEGLLFGGNKKLPPNLKDAFSNTGMTHIVAVSGYNVTIIATYLMLAGIFVGLWRKQAFFLAVLGIFIFVAMIGFPGSAVRAGVMGILILWALKNSRLANADNALLLAGALMLIINPLLLRWDIGFQLSFLATLGIIKTSPFWQKYTSSQNKYSMLAEIFFMTLSAQLFVLPIILYNFHTVSLVSLPANFLILPIIPLTMLFLLLTTLLMPTIPLLSLPFAWLSYWLLFYEIKVIEILAQLPQTALKFNDISRLFVIFWYAFLFLAIILLSKYEQKHKQIIF